MDGLLSMIVIGYQESIIHNAANSIADMIIPNIQSEFWKYEIQSVVFPSQSYVMLYPILVKHILSLKKNSTLSRAAVAYSDLSKWSLILLFGPKQNIT